MRLHRIGTAIGVVAACIMIGVSASMNVAFLSALGRTALESVILGAASGAADGLKALLPLFIIAAWRNQNRLFAVPASMVWVLFVAFSFMSAIGFAATNRIEIASTQSQLNASFTATQRQLRMLSARAEDLPPHRTVDALTAEIARHKQNRRWQTTRTCKAATVPESNRYCAAYFALQAELATAQEAKRLQRDLKVVKARVDALRRQGANQPVDPQVTLLATLLGSAPERIRLALILILAAVVEVGSSLGLYLATAHMAHRKPAAEAHDNPEAATLLTAQPVVKVEDWALARLVPQVDAVLPVSDAARDYVAFAALTDGVAMETDRFEDGLTSLAAQIGIDVRNHTLQQVRLDNASPAELPPGDNRLAA